MRIDWIEDLVALLDSGGVADAARLRNITQPAFSRRIRVLEDVLGIELIDRSVKPSGPSRVLRDRESDLRKQAGDLRRLVSEMRQEQTLGVRQLVIASQHAITTSLGTQIINAVAKPSHTHIRLRSANRDECETLLISRQAEIALTYRIKAEPAGEEQSFLAEAIIGSEMLIPVCATDHAEDLMARFREGTLRIIGYPADVFLGAAVTRHALSNLRDQCEISVIAETGLSTAALQLAQSGLGVAWVPEALAQPALQRGELRRLVPELGGIDMDLVAQRWASTPNVATLEAWTRLTTAL
ncbi:LysR substrate-binding domain-containing protein [Marivita hallyeonensis]|uniref:DNA-binding transcriptional regulator, LysR family n=1 Tax=Marivita hallyeonensis TaxID=996342 RepID=A0A1M5U715_9RHOB|nr:LysR substrate-binding domain-containing protein [Marivita hallyeonensis]SHH58855.1 DNA-binding transcriptional regulator, LysR family [Marivita hallyeonensis]